MSESRVLGVAEAWQRLLLRLYPVDFREELGEDMVEAYRDKCRAAFRRGGAWSVAHVCLTALVDSIRNGPGERVRPAVQWRRGGGGGRPRPRAGGSADARAMAAAGWRGEYDRRRNPAERPALPGNRRDAGRLRIRAARESLCAGPAGRVRHDR